MQSRWHQILDLVLRPRRPALARCLAEHEQYAADRRLIDDARTRAIAACEQRIHDARAAVFAANDGVVPKLMTELERDWRRLSRRDPDDGMMDLWARIAPATWLDRKRWRDSQPATRAELALGLAADVAGVEAAEEAAASLCHALGAWGVQIGARVRWRLLDVDADATSEPLSEPLLAARSSISARGDEYAVIGRLRDLEHDLQRAARERLPGRELLANSIAHAAFVDAALELVGPSELSNPVTPLAALWQAGYVVSAIDARGITLELPPLPTE